MVPELTEAESGAPCTPETFGKPSGLLYNSRPNTMGGATTHPPWRNSPIMSAPMPVSGDAAAHSSVPDRAVADWLVDNGRLRQTDLDRSVRLAQTEGLGLVAVLQRLGMVSERDLAEAFSGATGVPLLGPDDYPDSVELPEGLSQRFLKEATTLPLYQEEGRLVLAMLDPRDSFVQDAVRLATGLEVSPRVGIPGEITAALGRVSAGARAEGATAAVEAGEDVREEDIEHLRDMASEAPVIRLVNLILQKAVESRASDIHVEPFEGNLKVRLRIDGLLHEIDAPPARSTAAVISRIKIMARLNIAERRLPQDGRIKLRVMGKELDLRVSTVPTLYGESVVMRLLDKESITLDFAVLGFDGKPLERFLEVLHLPHGIILVTGPTGSGKSTTLYTALSRLNTPERKIITVEDPVEYQLDGVNQIQVKPQIGLNFSSALRSIVRQDPDVIMVGEMRDLETARIAVQSALTGHLVLSTLHTNDASSTVNRLLDMGVEDYLLTSTVNGILAQRLVRKLCPHCKEEVPVLPELREELQLDRYAPPEGMHLFQARGCDECAHTGYRGRLAILEFLVMTDAVRALVMRHAVSREIEAAARKDGMLSMYEDGLGKVTRGLTTLDEVLRVTQE
jgi:general secretion pathway protein E